MSNALLRAKRISFFAAIVAAVEISRSKRAGARVRSSWEGIRNDRRAAYLSGEGRIGQEVLSDLMAEFPQAATIWESDVWEWLGPDLLPRSSENRLYSLLRLSRTQVPLEALLTEALLQRPSDNALQRPARFALALKVARHAKLQTHAASAAVALAESLLSLCGCPYRRAAAEQLWLYCGRSLLGGVREGSRGVEYSKRTWDFMSFHCLSVEDSIKSMAYASPDGTELPFVVMEEVLRDVVSALTTPDTHRAAFIMSRYNDMEPTRRAKDRLPDVDGLSIWVERVRS
jgi:hypothetical protein